MNHVHQNILTRTGTVNALDAASTVWVSDFGRGETGGVSTRFICRSDLFDCGGFDPALELVGKQPQVVVLFLIEYFEGQSFVTLEL